MKPCKQCNQMRINGILTHESGCPDRHLTEAGYRHECKECGAEVFSDSRTEYECNCNETPDESEKSNEEEL